MRLQPAAIFVALIAFACSSSDEPPASPTVAALPAVFPAPGDLVDDRSVDRGASFEVPGDERRSPRPEGPADARVEQRLIVHVDGGSLMYPTTLRADAAIWFRSSHPVTDDALLKAVELVGAPSKEDLVAGRTSRVALGLEEAEGAPLIFYLRPEKRFEVGHWYRLRVAPSLQSEGLEPLGNQIVGFFRGPEPLRVSGVSCGWSGCTPEDRWIVSFNGEVAEDSLASCIRTIPRLDLGPLSVEGWSVAFQPRNPEVGARYRVVVDERCRGVDGQPLEERYETRLEVERPRARLSLAYGTGYVPPRSDGTPPRIVVGAAHTGKLTVGMTRLSSATLPTFLAENLRAWGGLSFDKASAETEVVVDPPGADRGEVDVPIPLGRVLGERDRGLVYVSVEAEHSDESDEPPQREALIQVTDLGLSVKSGPEDTLVWVTSLTDQRPSSGVTVTGLDGAGKALWTAQTDERGIALGPGRQPTDDASGMRVVMASLGDDLAFIDLNDYDNRSEPYEFGISQAWDPPANALRGIVFSERGVYRTAETVHLKGFLRVERGGRLESLGTSSVTVKITDPYGDRALSRELTLGAVGDFEIDLDLPESAKLGAWRVEVSAADGANGHVAGSFRVEAYRPNTFAVKVDELTRTLEVDGQDRRDRISARATGRYYHGAAMSGATARWWLHRADAGFEPKGYSGYRFEVPSWAYDTWEPYDTSVEAVASGEAVLGDDGSERIEASIADLAASLEKGPQKLTLEVEVSDVDQQTVTGRASMRVESADYYLGVRAATRFVGVGEAVEVEAVAVAPDGSAVAGEGFEVRFVRRTWKGRYEVVAGGGRTWRSEMQDKVLARERLVSGDAPVRARFTAPASGQYWIEAEGRDARGRAMKTRQSVWVWGQGASWADNDQGHVELVPAKDSYQVGETARFVVQSPFESARALITVEANSIVWRDTQVLEGTAPLIEIPVSDAMMPNAYVSVVLIGVPVNTEAHSAEAEVRLGYHRIDVDTSARRLSVEVTPDQPDHRPGDAMQVTIDLADASGNPSAGLVTFMAVDEGVLSLTGYHTPDPHQAFFKERSVAIVTSEARSQLWSRLVADDGMKSDWGGGGDGGEATNYRSAFATTAAYFPDVEVGADGRAQVSFQLPENLTTFRLMAVAATADGRFGKGESSVEVNKPLLVRPGLPRFLSVGDRFDARAVVQAVDPELRGDVAVTMSVSGPIEIAGSDTQQIEVGPRATPVVFEARALRPGMATFAFKVVARRGSGAITDAVQVDVPVLWPAAVRSANTSGRLDAESDETSTTLQIPDWVRDDIGGVDVTLTSTRLGELLPGLDYLVRYPYGCVEQTTGGTLPLLALRELQSGFELPGIGRQEVLARAQAGIDRLRSMQTWSGGLGYWPGDSSPHPWGSVYAGMALVRASQTEGLDVPAASIERLTSYLRDILRDQAASGRDEWHSELEVVKPFAAWVLALAGTPEPAFNAGLFAEREALPEFGKLLLALAIDASHGDQVMANTLLDEVLDKLRVDGRSANLERDEGRYYHSTMDSDVRSLALLALALQAIRPDDLRLAKVQQGLLDARRNGRWISTQDNAFAILALARTFLERERTGASFVAKVELDGQVWLEERMSSDDPTPRTLHLPMYLAKKANGRRLTIVRDGDEAPIYFTLRLDYTPREVPREAIIHGFEISRRYRIASGPRAGQDAHDVAAGDLIRVDLTVRTAEPRRYVAVDDPLPAGLEPVTLDFATTRSSLADLTASEDSADDYYWRPEAFNHTEQRDDRVVAFADVMAAGKHTYTYLARATAEGSFVAPAARVHEMYQPDVFGQTTTRQVVVR